MDNRRSLRRITNLLRPLNADLICFQEVYRWFPTLPYLDQPMTLGDHLLQPVAFHPCIRYWLVGYGVATVATKLSSQTIRHKLPSSGEQRGALELRYSGIKGLPGLRVFNTHLGLNAEERMAQIKMLATLVNESDSPALLCGDLNAVADSEEIQFLLKETGMKDAGETTNFNTFISSNPTRRIDFILYSRHFSLSEFKVLPSHASDHLAIVADFIIEP